MKTPRVEELSAPAGMQFLPRLRAVGTEFQFPMEIVPVRLPVLLGHRARPLRARPNRFPGAVFSSMLPPD
jgi:hypothetical protein